MQPIVFICASDAVIALDIEEAVRVAFPKFDCVATEPAALEAQMADAAGRPRYLITQYDGNRVALVPCMEEAAVHIHVGTMPPLPKSHVVELPFGSVALMECLEAAFSSPAR